MKKVALIMAGGLGSRFFPYSSKETPKYLNKIFGDECILNQTINRISKTINMEDIYIVTGKDYEDAIKKSITLDFKLENILVEPDMKNTAPCIAYHGKIIKEKYKEAVIVTLPCDHFIKEDNKYIESINKGIDLAIKEKTIVTIGLTPSTPDTGYGYIHSIDNKVIGFKEKPDLSKAIEYINDNNYYYNSGIFIYEVNTLLTELKVHCNNVYDSIINYNIEEGYKLVENISIDYALLEKTNNIAMIRGDFIWSDVGSWERVFSVSNKDNKNISSNVQYENIDSNNIYIKANNTLKKVSLVGVSNLIIVEKNDELLICSMDSAQEVKRVKK